GSGRWLCRDAHRRHHGAGPSEETDPASQSMDHGCSSFRRMIPRGIDATGASRKFRDAAATAPATAPPRIGGWRAAARRIAAPASRAGIRTDAILLPDGVAGGEEGGEDPPVEEVAVEQDLRVSGALELLEDDLVHSRSRVDQGRRDDGQRAAPLGVPGGAEEPAGLLHRPCIDAPREDLASALLHLV